MSALAGVLLALLWLLSGLAAAAWLARLNQARGVRRLTTIERRIGLVYLTGALAGPASWLAVGVTRWALSRLDRATERARAAEARARAERARERARARQTAS